MLRREPLLLPEVRVNVSNALPARPVRVNVSNSPSRSPVVIPVSLLVYNPVSLCNSAFCAGFIGCSCTVSRFTVGHFPSFFPFHCWAVLNTRFTVGQYPRSWPLVPHNVEYS